MTTLIPYMNSSSMLSLLGGILASLSAAWFSLGTLAEPGCGMLPAQGAGASNRGRASNFSGSGSGLRSGWSGASASRRARSTFVEPNL